MGIRETREMLRPVSKRAASHPFWGRSDRRFFILTRTADASSEPLPLDWHNSNSIKDICACCQIDRFSGLCL